jgi:predicted N-acetyltransferase YhbS
MSDFEIAKYDRNECLLCRRNGQVVGQVNVRDLRQEYFGGYVIWNLLVFPDHRNQGVGEALVNCILLNFNDAPVYITAEPFYDTEGLGEEQLTAWYCRMGFVQWNHPQNEDGKWMIHKE